MGADMLAATIAVPASRTAPIDYAAGHTAIDVLTLADYDFDDFWALAENVLVESLGDDDPVDADGNPANLALAQQVCHAIVDQLKDALEDPREVTDLRIGGYTVYLSAGLSSGDAPTDAAEAIWNAGELPASVLSAMGFALDDTQPPGPSAGTAAKPTDTDVIDAIALGLGTSPEWSGAETLEWIADLIGKVREHPGDQDPRTYLENWKSRFSTDPLESPFLRDYIDDEAALDEDEDDDA